MRKTIRTLTLVAAMIVGAGETWADNVDYLDASGTSKTCTTAMKITGSSDEVQLGADGTETWYYVDGTVNISNVVKVNGDVHLILCDNAKLNVTIENNVGWEGFNYTPAIRGDYYSHLTIYSQSTGDNMGSLTAYVNDETNKSGITVYSWSGLTINGGKVTTNVGINVNDFTINGGELTVSKAGWGIYTSGEDPSTSGLFIYGGKVTAVLHAYGPIRINGGVVTAEAVGDYPAIYAERGWVGISGGQVTATSTGGIGIGAENDGTNVEIWLGWDKATDFITASSYYVNVESDNYTAVVKTEYPDRFVAYNAPTGTAASAIFSGDYENSGIVSEDDLKAIAGKTLRPLNGYCVSTTDPNIILTAGSTAKTPDFTITTGEGDGAVTTLYYICSENDVMTLSMPAGCVTSGYTVKKSEDGTDVTNTVLSSSTLIMPAYDITVEATKTDLWGIGAGAKGTLEHPYTITTTDGLDLLAKMVNGTNGYAANDFSGKYFVLGNDITYTHKQAGETGADTENNYTAIGGWNSNFQGTFDGQGHTVSGIRIYKGGSEKGDKLQGLFGNINGGTMCHVTLDDAQITGYEDTGGIVGYNNGGNITDCHVTENVCISAQQSTSSHGGIVGDNGGSVNGCTSKAKIKTNSSSCDYFGGIAGCNGPQGTMKDCLYLGSEVEGNSCVGAVAGENKGSIINCYYTDYFSGKGADGSPISNNAIGSNYGTATNTGLAKTITLGEGVTLNGTAADYGPASPNTSDVRITSYATAADQPGFALKLETVSGTTTTTAYYSTSGATVALGYSGIVPTGSFVDYVVTAAGSNVAVSEANTFVIPDYKVTVSTKLYMKNVPYMTWDDTKKKLVDATTPDATKVYLLTGGGATTLPGGWYVVMNTNTDATVDEGIDAHYTGTLTFNGDANIILGDGANMTLRRELFYLITEGIIVNEGSLAIYAQSTGKNQGGLFAFCDLSKTAINVVSANTDANITINGGDIGIIVVEGDCISANSTGGNACVTINGGSTIVNGGSYGYGISARSDAIRNVTINDGIIEIKGGDADILVSGNTVTSGPSTLTINGGSVSASGNNGFIVASSDSKGKITLGWKNSTTDFIRADKYTVDGVVTIAANKRFFVYGTQAVIGDDTAEATITDLTTIEEQNLIPVIPLPTIGGQYMLIYKEEAYYKVVTSGVKTYVVSGYDLSGTPAVGITEVTGGGVPKGFPIIIGVESGNLPNSIGLVLADDEATTIDGNTKAANPLKNLIVCDGSSSVGALLAAALGGTADLSEYVLFTFVNGSFRPVFATAESKPDKGICLLAIPKVDILTKGGSGSGTSNARTLSIDLGGDATGIQTPPLPLPLEGRGVEDAQPLPTPEGAGCPQGGAGWYDLQGRRLSGQPTQKGVYIRNGRADVVQ